jgi:hypothetical protein
MPHPRFALKFLIGSSLLKRWHGRTNWVLMLAFCSTAATFVLIALYLLQRGVIG